jgi:hypothetical protein
MLPVRVLLGLLVLTSTGAGCSLLLDFGGELKADAAPADAGPTDAAPFPADAGPSDAAAPLRQSRRVMNSRSGTL